MTNKQYLIILLLLIAFYQLLTVKSMAGVVVESDEHLKVCYNDTDYKDFSITITETISGDFKATADNLNGEALISFLAPEGFEFATDHPNSFFIMHNTGDIEAAVFEDLDDDLAKKAFLIRLKVDNSADEIDKLTFKIRLRIKEEHPPIATFEEGLYRLGGNAVIEGFAPGTLCGIFSVRKPPLTDFSSLPPIIDGKIKLCEGDSFTFYVPDDNYKYEYKLGEGDYTEVAGTSFIAGDNLAANTVYPLFIRIYDDILTECSVIKESPPIYVEVNSLPTGELIVNDTGFCMGAENIQLKATASNDSDEIRWFKNIEDIPDNPDGTGPVYSSDELKQLNPGIYTYYVTISNDYCTSSYTEAKLSIFGLPEAVTLTAEPGDFEDNTFTACLGEEITFTADVLDNNYIYYFNVENNDTMKTFIQTGEELPEPHIFSMATLSEGDSVWVRIENEAGCQQVSEKLAIVSGNAPQTPLLIESSIKEGVILTPLTNNSLQISYCQDDMPDILKAEKVTNQIDDIQFSLQWYQDNFGQDQTPISEGTTLALADYINTAEAVEEPVSYIFYLAQSQQGKDCISPPIQIEVIINPLPTPELYPLPKEQFCKDNFEPFIIGFNAPGDQAFGIISIDTIKDGKPVLLKILGAETGEDFNSVLFDINGLFSGYYELAYTLITDVTDCRKRVSVPISIAQTTPGIHFNFSDICISDSAVFYNTSKGTNEEGVEWKWFFGEGDSLIFNDIHKPNGIHKYEKQGYYPVTLSFKDHLCEIDSFLTLYIAVFDTLSIKPGKAYFEDFESSDHNWISSSDIKRGNASSWQRKSDGVNAWFTTGGTGKSTYNNNERSWVESPCFDISTLKKPMISLNIMYETEQGKDGAVLQYTLNNGATWQVLGSLHEGLNWYNEPKMITYNDTTFDGWSGFSNGWIKAGARLDKIIQQIKEIKGATGNSEVCIRFRIGFFSDESGVSQGFAFDDVHIGERNRVVLVQHFTNSEANKAYEQNKALAQQLENKGVEAYSLNYHLRYPGMHDPLITSDNRPYANAMAFNYGLAAPVKTIIDGGVVYQTVPLWWNELNPSPFNIHTIMLHKLNGHANKYQVEATIEVANNKIAPAHVINEALLAQMVIVEKKIVVGNETWHHVVQKMLPDAAGTRLTDTWTNNRSEHIKNYWDLPLERSLADYVIVVFLMGEKSRKVYQAVFKDLEYVSDYQINTITSLPSLNTEHKMSIYPNPSSGDIYLSLDYAYKEALHWHIVSVTGQLLLKGIIPAGEQKKLLPTKGLVKGIYLLSISDESSTITKHLVVIR